jgi:hypothetical protein
MKAFSAPSGMRTCRPKLDERDASLGDQAAREALGRTEEFGHLRDGEVAVSHGWALR